MPLISVLLSVYNGEASIVDAVESIRAQTFTDWELIAVDDASRDRTGALLHDFDDERIRILCNDRNQGLAASLNAAFRTSRGKLIARMDADDVALPDRFAKQVAFLEAHPDVDVLGGGALLLGEAGTSMRRETHEEIAAQIFKENPFIHPAVMMRRHVLEELGGYDESLRRAQDYDLWLRGISRFRYHNLQEPLIRYKRPDKPTWTASGFAARVVWMNARRQGSALRGLWFAGRHVAAFSLWKLTGWAR